ncbi:MAG: cell division protein FtsZ [Bacteroidetes bacterium]|nr:cell division protein FtsZ [Bacteroidota bacterium]
MIELDTREEYGARIKVVGIGGGGSNAVNAMIDRGLVGVEFCVFNTDMQALQASAAALKLQIGRNLTRGLGAGANPDIGRRAVDEDREEIAEMLRGSDMVFVTAGMGGGTGTGGAARVAQIAKENGALVVGIVTRPFFFEGKRRLNQAEDGIQELRKNVDTLIVIPNQKLLALVTEGTSLLDGFEIANQVLYNATRGISELITRHGHINVDFADVRTVMTDMGDAIMGAGVASGAHRAAVAAESAISSPLLEGVSIQGAQGVLVNITGGRSMTLLEVSEATQIIHDSAGDDANIIFGAVLDETMDDEIMVTVIATGFNNKPTFTGLSVDEKPAVPYAPAEEVFAQKSKPSVVRMTPPMSMDEYEVRKKIIAQQPPQRERSEPSTHYEEDVQLPKVERMSRGTLTERQEDASAFDRLSAGAFRASSIRLSPMNETSHVPSGPRDLKEYDTPAYLRRGINIPSVDEQEEIEALEREHAPETVMAGSGGGGVNHTRERDDRPTFLRKIMD